MESKTNFNILGITDFVLAEIKNDFFNYKLNEPVKFIAS